MSARAADGSASAGRPIEREDGPHNRGGNAAGRDGVPRKVADGALAEGSLAEAGGQGATGEGFGGKEVSAEEWLASKEWTEQDDDLDECRAAMLRESLDAYDLDEKDVAMFVGGAADRPAAPPVLAVVGRPNIGKSTLVNRTVGRRVAAAQDVPGVTRDRMGYPASWAGRDFTLVDTGGWEIDVAGIDASVAHQAEVAVQVADAVVLVVDASVGITGADADIVELFRRSKRPVVLAADKVDFPMQESDTAMLWGLGLGKPYPISALHGRGTGDLLDAVLAAPPEYSAVAAALPEGPWRVALLGRSNAGKSSPLNRLAGSERVAVDPTAETTRDPVDETIEPDGQTWIFVDTADIRYYVHQTKDADFCASLCTRGVLSKAELALVFIDASELLTEQDFRVMQRAIDARRVLIVVCNKWDSIDEHRRCEFDREMDHDLVQVQWAERINLSVATGWHTNRLTRAMDTALDSWEARVPTGKLSAFLGELTAAHSHPVRSGRQLCILFATQASTRLPCFILFASGFVEAGYRRFVEDRIRGTFGSVRTSVETSVRVREKRKKGGKR